ncbi:hypothetical protein MBLNU457_3764t1 [Dothideomycetes sp. NU457]
MAIPSRPGSENASPHAPPALPPPRYPPQEIAVRVQTPPTRFWGNNSNPHFSWKGFEAEPSSLGPQWKQGRTGSREDEDDDLDIDPSRRFSTITVKPMRRDTEENLSTSAEDHYRRPSVLFGGYSLQSERQLGQRNLDDSSNAYDRNLLSKIGGPKTPSPHRLSIPDNQPLRSPSVSDLRNAPPLKRLSVPTRRPSSIDDLAALPTRAGSMTALGSSTLSPGAFRSPTYDRPEFTRPPLPHRNSSMSSFSSVETISHRGSTDSALFPHEEFPGGEGRMRELNIDDYSPGASDDPQSRLQHIARAGMKRRASSPQRDPTRDDRSSVSSVAPTNDFNRTNSLASTYTRPSISSSVTSFASGWHSPTTLSPAALESEPTTGGLFPFPTPNSSATSPRASVSHPGYQRVDTLIEETRIKRPPEEDVLPSPRNASISLSTPTMPDTFICDCCPKKPKKFHTEDDLRMHMMEKQYTCLYCNNRFKNKNEAERHQNSLHLRRHSWSCAALSGIERAYQPTHPGSSTDICGFCGDEFPNPPNWDVRRDHLNIVHKHGECNQTKKFFRADHFRQHLKHSHAGTSGKWTNHLENACMRDEPPPQPLNRGSGLMHADSASAGQTYLPANASALSGPGGIPAGIKPETIDENPHE